MEAALGAEGIALLAWRVVPVDPAALSQRAPASLPRIEQAIVACPEGWEPEIFERRLLLARKGMERMAPGLEGFTIPSASCRTVVYKGLFTANKIDDFYWDLRDPGFETRFAIFHQRYSTNTFPSWSIAQPFRTLAHNGEINTIRSNRAWMVAREVGATSPVWGDRIGDLRPFLEPDQSDSGSLDNAFELLVRTGRSLAHVKEMLVPTAWENVADLDPDLRAFYEYHAFLAEPWDGPAAVAATDGKSCSPGWTAMGSARRGGRSAPMWCWWPRKPASVRRRRRGHLPPGSSAQERPSPLSSASGGSPSRTRSGRSGGAAPYRDWLDNETLYVQQPSTRCRTSASTRSASAGSSATRPRSGGMVLQDMAEGKTPTGSMGNDTPLAVLSTTPRRITHYFHELFAQVTNPPMDHIREHLVMSLRTYLGERGSLLEETPQQAHLIEIA